MIIDDYDFLCENQVLTESAYANYGWNLIAPRDWGHREVPLYCEVRILGPHDKDLTIDLVVKQDKSSPVEVVATTGSIKKADLVRGKIISIPVPPLDKRYQYITVQFRREGVAPVNPPDTGFTCPTDPFLDPMPDLANGVTALFTNNFHCTIEYPRANTDKVYSS